MFKSKSVLVPGGITCAEWQDANAIVCGLTDGTVWLRDVRARQRSFGPLVCEADSGVTSLAVVKDTN